MKLASVLAGVLAVELVRERRRRQAADARTLSIARHALGLVRACGWEDATPELHDAIARLRLAAIGFTARSR